MLGWANRFSIFCFLDNHDYSIDPHQHDCLLGAGAAGSVSTSRLSDVRDFLKPGNWAFGHLSYGLRHSIHGFSSSKPDPIGFPDAFFFHPMVMLRLNAGTLSIDAEDPESVYKEIMAGLANHQPHVSSLSIQARLSREAYLDRIAKLKEHIVRGDCYEINFCQEFFAEQATIDPLSVFQELTAQSPNPFAALYKLDDRYLICASPERFLTKKGNRLISQPMKGTIRRDRGDAQNDAALKHALAQSAKDQSENVMVVDLVRNDLSKVCEDGSVQVDELFGVYSYPNVHQMISTISGTIQPGKNFADIMEATFPMGSMTGAPKRRVIELIDQYETTSRGIFSGSVGYIDPDGDFDLNVVIRSIMYRSDTGYLSYQLGSGITFYSDPEQEWAECLLKGEAIRKVLGGQ